MTILVVAALLVSSQDGKPDLLPTGKGITPAGKHVAVGSYPLNMVVTKDGNFVVTTTVGFREFLSVLDVKTGHLTGQIDVNLGGSAKGQSQTGLYFGLAVDPVTGLIFASNGAADTISTYSVSERGSIQAAGLPVKLPSSKARGIPWHPAGIALTSDGRRLITVNNQTNDVSKFRGSFSVIDIASGHETLHGETAGFPFGCALVTKGDGKDRKLFVGSERDGVVEAFDISSGEKIATLKTGEAPTCMVLDENQTTLYVANASSDTVAVIDVASNQVKSTILLRPAAMRGLQGVTPLGMALSPKGTHLYVACSDMNCVADVNIESGKVAGYIPTGWLPTSVVAVKGSILVASAKGVKATNPNAKALMFPGLKRPDHYIENIIDGTVSLIQKPSKELLNRYTAQVIANNKVSGALVGATHPTFKNPGIKHVIYVVKENRTYDNVLGDLKQGNGDSSQCMFPRQVTPNQHALAERFVLLDNFHWIASGGVTIGTHPPPPK